MLYKFKSKAAGDVVMLEETAHQVLRILGREPQAKGILEVAAMPAATAAIEAAVEEEEQARREAQAEAAANGRPKAPRLGQRTSTGCSERTCPCSMTADLPAPCST